MANPADPFREMVGKIAEATRDAVIEALSELGADIVADLKLACPVKTGALRNTIRYEVINKNGNPALEIYVGNEEVYYAPFIEYGTARILKHPFVRPVMAKYKNRINDVISGSIETAWGNHPLSEQL